jgi:hypothetical protein
MMNKEILIDKIAFISEELQVQSMDWLKRGYQITPLEVGVFLSNINYLAEQANYLNHFLKTVEGLPAVPVPAMPIINTAVTIESLSAAISNAAPSNQTNASQQPEITLHERLSEQTSNTSLADTLKRQSSIKDLSFSVNDKMFIVSNLFDDNQNDFNRIMSHVATLDAWDEVEIYLNETCTIPYQWENKEADKKHFFRILKQRFA